jgi:hypothetical protein
MRLLLIALFFLPGLARAEATALQWIEIKGVPTFSVPASPFNEESQALFSRLSPEEQERFSRRRAKVIAFVARVLNWLSFVPATIQFITGNTGRLFAVFGKPPAKPPIARPERVRRAIQKALRGTNALLWKSPAVLAHGTEFGLRFGANASVTIAAGKPKEATGERMESARSHRGDSYGLGTGLNLGINVPDRYLQLSVSLNVERLTGVAGLVVGGGVRSEIGGYAKVNEKPSPLTTVGEGIYAPAPAFGVVTHERIEGSITPEFYFGVIFGAKTTVRHHAHLLDVRLGLSDWKLAGWRLPYLAADGLIPKGIAAAVRTGMRAVKRTCPGIACGCARALGKVRSGGQTSQ